MVDGEARQHRISTRRHPADPYFAEWDGGVTTTVNLRSHDFVWDSELLHARRPTRRATPCLRRAPHVRQLWRPASVTNCFTAQARSAEGNSNRIKEPGDLAAQSQHRRQLALGDNPYYRITVKVTGPRGTVTYVQAVIY